MSTQSRINSAFGQLLASMPGKNIAIFKLSRIYSTLAVCAALFISISFLINGFTYNRQAASDPLRMFGIILNWLVLILAAGATIYGLKIARQANADARKNEEAIQESSQRAKELAVLYDTVQELAGQQDLAAVLQTIVERAKALLNASGCAIFLRDMAHGNFEIAAEIGVGMPVGAHLSIDEGLAGRVAQTMAPVVVNDFNQWPYRSQSLKQLPIGAAVCVPMIRAGEFIGALGVHENANAGRKFTDAEARLLSLFGDNAAGFVYNARLLDAFRRSEERFRIAARCASDMIYDWDLANDQVDYFGAIFEKSQKVVSHLPKTRQQYLDIIHPEDLPRVQAALKRHFDEGKPFSEEYRIRTRKGYYNSIMDKATAIRNSKGRPDKLIGAVIDITERKHAEQMKTDFVSFVTHQLRTPLSGVKWMLELAMDGSDSGEDMRSFVQDARASTERLIGLVNDLLDVSRMERGRLQITCKEMDLGAITRDVAAEIATLIADRKHAFYVDIADDLPHLHSDPQLLRQVVLNLMSNAIKYTPSGGSIKVRVSHGCGQIHWEIKDNGIGISKPDLEKLFEKFYRAGNALSVETEGTGLGLYLVRLIVERLGGNIRCESKENAGSTFLFDIPLESKEDLNDRRANSIS